MINHTSYLSESTNENQHLSNRIVQLEAETATLAAEFETKMDKMEEKLKEEVREVQKDNEEKEEEVIQLGEKLQDAFMLQEQVEA